MKTIDHYVIGIDPGKKGGLCLMMNQTILHTSPIPDLHRDLYEKLLDWKETAVSAALDPVVYLEVVHASPQMGVSSAFTFGKGFGLLLGLLTALEFRLELVSPQRWQKLYGVKPRSKCLSNTEHKNLLKSVAQRLFPKLTITHAIADAILIAEYGRRMELGNQAQHR